MLVAARSCQDLACCWRAIVRACSKEAFAWARFGCGDINAISPAILWTSASHHLSLVASITAIASVIVRRASSKRPNSAYAFAKYERYGGNHVVAPVERHAEMPALVASMASSTLPVSANT